MSLRLIQVGLGGWGRSWTREVTGAVPGVQPVAWVEGDPAVRAQAIAELGLPPGRVVGSLAEAAALGGEAVLVVVPQAAHAAVAGEALQLGLHVLVEKPFTETLAEAVGLTRLAGECRLVLMVSQNYRHFPAPIAARRLLAEAAIGEALAVHVDFHRLYGPDYRYFFLAEPLLGDMAIHHFDTMRFVLGDEPETVSCVSWGEPAMPFQGPPAAVATIRFRRGTVISYRGSWISRGPETPYGAVWRIEGSASRVDFRFRGTVGNREIADEVALGGVPVPLDTMALVDRRGSLGAFAAWVAAGTPPDGTSTAADNLQSLGLMFAAIRSARMAGAWVRVADILEEAGA